MRKLTNVARLSCRAVGGVTARTADEGIFRSKADVVASHAMPQCRRDGAVAGGGVIPWAWAQGRARTPVDVSDIAVTN